MTTINVRNLFRDSIKVALTIGKETIPVQVDAFPTAEKNAKFLKCVLDNVFFESGYHPERTAIAMDLATVTAYTDLDLGDATQEEVDCFLYATNVGAKVRDALRNHYTDGRRSYLDDLVDGAYRYIDYYRQMITPRSAVDEVLENLNSMITDVRKLLDAALAQVAVVDKADVSPQELKAAVRALQEMDSKALVDALASQVQKD